MSATLIAAIPPQAYTDPILPLHIHATANDGQRVAYGSASGVVLRCLPDQVSFKFRPVETYLGSKKPILSAAVAPNGRAIVGGDSDGICYVWLKAKGGIDFVAYKLDGLRYVKMIDIAISPDSRRLAIVGVDRYSKRLAAAILIDGGMAIGKIDGHTKGIGGVTFSPVKPFNIVTGGFDGKIIQHEGPPFKVKRSTPATSQQIWATRFSHCGRRIAACGSGGWVGLFDGPTIEPVKETTLPGSAKLLSLAWSSHAQGFAVIGEDFKLSLIDGSSLDILQTISTPSGKDDMPKGVGWSQTGWILVPCASGHIRGWKVQGGGGAHTEEEELRRLEAALEEERVNRSKEGYGDDMEEVEEADPNASALAQESKGPLGSLIEQPSFTWYGPKGNPTAVAFDSETGNLVVGTSLGFVMFLSTDQTVPSCFQVSRMEKEVTVKSCLMNDKCAAAVTSDGTVKFFKVRTTNIKAGDIHNRVRETLEITSAGAQATVFKSATRQELVHVASAQVDKTPLKLLFMERGAYIGLICTCGTFFVYSINRALQCSDPNGAFRYDWHLSLLGRPMAAAASGDGTLLAIALWPSSDYPDTKFGSARPTLPKPEADGSKLKAPVSPQRNRARSRPLVTFDTTSPVASPSQLRISEMPAAQSVLRRGKSMKHIVDMDTRPTSLMPPSPIPASPPAALNSRRTSTMQSTSTTPRVSIVTPDEEEAWAARKETDHFMEDPEGRDDADEVARDERTEEIEEEESPAHTTFSEGSTLASPMPVSPRKSPRADETSGNYSEPILPLIEIYEVSNAGNVDGLRFICVLDNHSREISSVSLNKDGSLLATADLSREIRVTEIESRKELITTQWNYHSTRVSGLDWSPDGSKLVSASTNEVFVWDVDKPFSSISVKDVQTGNVQFVRFIFNNTLVVAGSDGVMKVYEVVYD